MTSAIPWAPTFDFESDPDPQNLINAAALQAQLSALAASLGDLYVALSTAIGDDNSLTDELVRIRNLHPELRTYLDARLSGTILTNSLDYRYPVRAASTANITTLVGAQTKDGVALVSGDRFAAKDQTIKSQNGIWIVHEVGDPSPHAAGLWVRADDLPAGEPSGKGWAVIVREGLLNGNTAWYVVAGGDPADQPVVGTDDLDFAPVFAPFPLPIARGGTGATTAAAALLALGAAGKFTDQITGDGSTTTFVVNHTLGTALLVAAIQQNADGEEILVTVIKTSTTVTFAFATPPANAVVYDVILVG